MATKTKTTIGMKVFIQGPGAFAYMAMFIREGMVGAKSPEEADIICFTGGEDVSPMLYGEQVHPKTYCSQRRDDLDMKVFEVGKRMGKFMVGICRGGQFLNVMNGGKMWQHVTGHGLSHYARDVESGEEVFVSSTHHQMMRPGPDSTIVMIADEVATLKESMTAVWQAGNVESDPDIESVYYAKTRCLCYQPHPEFTGKGQEENTSYFFRLIERFFWQVKDQQSDVA